MNRKKKKEKEKISGLLIPGGEWYNKKQKKDRKEITVWNTEASVNWQYPFLKRIKLSKLKYINRETHSSEILKGPVDQTSWSSIHKLQEETVIMNIVLLLHACRAKSQ
jgi:hypothetical protein